MHQLQQKLGLGSIGLGQNLGGGGLSFFLSPGTGPVCGLDSGCRCPAGEEEICAMKRGPL